MSRVVTAVSFLVVVVLSVELAVWEAFLVAARPFGTTLPLAAALAVVGNLGVGLLGARVLGRTAGAAVPGLLWLGVALTLGTRTAGGSVVVTGGWRGIAFLVAGAATAAAAVGLTGAAKNRATPEGGSRR